MTAREQAEMRRLISALKSALKELEEAQDMYDPLLNKLMKTVQGRQAMQLENKLSDIACEIDFVLGKRRWPRPTKAQPSAKTLDRWLEDDKGCGTTDGCWVSKIDGVCAHGYPSWARYLRLF